MHEYTIKDHLGNARVTYSDGNNDGIITVADIKQINHYYPFGMNMEGSWNGAAGSNKYQYNGKEWNDDFGLGLNDYGARFYDPAIGRWGAVDPLSEKRRYLSGYQYVQNNPLNRTDPTGMLDQSFYGRDIKAYGDAVQAAVQDEAPNKNGKNDKVELYYTNATSGIHKLGSKDLVAIISKTAGIMRKNGILNHLSFKSISKKEAEKYEKGGRDKAFVAFISHQEKPYGKSDITNDQRNYIGVYDKENEKFKSYVNYGRIVGERGNFPDPIYGTAYAMAHEYLHQLLSFAGTVLDKDAYHYIHRNDYRNLNFDGENNDWTFPLQVGDDIIIPEQIKYLNRYFEYLKTH